MTHLPFITGYGGPSALIQSPGRTLWCRPTSLSRPRSARPRTWPARSPAIAGVTQAEDVTGPYDVIVRAEARNVDELGKLVVAQIQAVEGITRTLTCPIVHI